MPECQSPSRVETRLSKKLRERAAESAVATLNKSKRGIFSLPREVFLLILGYVEMPWQLSLALTCKGMMAAVFPGDSLQEFAKQDVTEVLALLPKDIPYTYFCFCCNKLRPLNPEVDWDSQEHRWTAGNITNGYWPSNHNDEGHIFLPRSYFSFISKSDIYFMDVHLAMNRHFYGPSHGIPLQVLERHESLEESFSLHKCQHGYDFIDHINDIQALEKNPDGTLKEAGTWRFSLESIPKIIDDELYIAQCHTVVGPIVPWQHFARLLTSVRIKICWHLDCSARSHPWFCRRFGSPRRPPTQGNGLLITSFMGDFLRHWVPYDYIPERGSCSFCITDWEISLRKDRAKGEWQFSLNTYHCLGTCRSPDDPLWRYFARPPNATWDPSVLINPNIQHALAANAAQVEELKLRRQKFDRGGVRQKWKEADVNSGAGAF